MLQCKLFYALRSIMVWDKIWDKVFTEHEWGRYPAENLIRFIANNY